LKYKEKANNQVEQTAKTPLLTPPLGFLSLCFRLTTFSNLVCSRRNLYSELLSKFILNFSEEKHEN